ncbi:MAG: hypothetical protein KGK08_01275 [Acidobacteriota bacterium]|nr:hypothetical protein [Acidobacteriota bacterium]
MPQEHPRRNRLRALTWLCLGVAASFFALHLPHLRADFPNYSPWMDWSKYTDEGWYGDAAIRHFQRGSWYVPGDFNPAAALPVWPVAEGAVFHFTGVRLEAARGLTVGLFGLTLLAAYLLLRRWQPRGQASLAPALGVLLLAVSPFCYVFYRMAILEPLLVLWMLVALHLASSLRPEPPRRGNRWPTLVWPALLGLVMTLMVLTKTTAVFLMPALFWMIWVRAEYRLRPLLRLGGLACGTAAAAWLGYYLVVVRPHYLLDYRYLFSANAYTGITAATALSVLADTVADGMWIGKLLYPLALLAVLLVVLHPTRSARQPLLVALLLWAGGYFAFLAYHDNLQPRYYLVVAVPLTLIVPLVFEGIWQARPQPDAHHLMTHRLASGSLVLALVVTVGNDMRHTLEFVRHPEYTFANAAQSIRAIVEAEHRRDPSHSELVLSISGSDVSLMTGLPSICDDFGTTELPQRVHRYHPGWYLTWNDVEDDKMEALNPLYHLERIAEFPAMDDPDRNLLILYRLDPATPGQHLRPHHRRPIPRLLQTAVGQQPSVVQLEH